MANTKSKLICSLEYKNLYALEFGWMTWAANKPPKNEVKHRAWLKKLRAEYNQTLFRIKKVKRISYERVTYVR